MRLSILTISTVFLFFCMRFHAEQGGRLKVLSGHFLKGHGSRSVLSVDDSDAASPKIMSACGSTLDLSENKRRKR